MKNEDIHVHWVQVLNGNFDMERFIVRDSDTMTNLTLYNKLNQIVWGEIQLLSPYSVHVFL